MTLREPSPLEIGPDVRLLVIAPHPDDDALGCGGTLALAASVGGATHVAYLTDGTASHPGSRTVSRAALREIREAEARAGLAALGIASTSATFFRAADGALDARDAALTARLAELARAFRPTIVLAPFERDAHPDHRAAATIARAALVDSGCRARLLRYAVWLAHRGAAEDQASPRDGASWFVDTAPVLAAKRRAVAAHRSQFGRVVRDDPAGFRLPHDLVVRACARDERFLEGAMPWHAGPA